MRGRDAEVGRGESPELREGIPVLLFKGPRDWERWLAANHAESSGVWLKIAKRDSGLTSVTYAEALELALCYGWIDGKLGKYDDRAYVQRFTPRKARSIWSKVNRDKAMQLIAAGRMQPSGIAAIEAAKQNGQWEAAYDSIAEAHVPADLAAALAKNPAAREFFATLKGRNRYAILHRLQTAVKPETRAKRLAKFVEMLERGETIYPKE